MKTKIEDMPQFFDDHRAAERFLEFLDLRKHAIYQRGYADGMHRANNNHTPTIGDLELRIHKATDLLRQAIDALNSPAI